MLKNIKKKLHIEDLGLFLIGLLYVPGIALLVVNVFNKDPETNIWLLCGNLFILIFHIGEAFTKTMPIFKNKWDYEKNGIKYSYTKKERLFLTVPVIGYFLSIITITWMYW